MHDPQDQLQYVIKLLEETASLLAAMDLRLQSLEAQSQPASEQTERIDAKAASELLRIHPRTLDRYRSQWIEGVHFFPQAKGYQYNAALLEDWVRNRFNQEAHERAIAIWQSRQLSNTQLKPGRKRRAS